MGQSPRVAYLDNLRVLLTVLVVLHHVAAGYADIGAWYYHEPVSGPGSLLFFTFLMAVNQAFFMGAFFLLAGYFVPPSLARKGTRGFLRERFRRLGVPFVFYFFVLNALVCRLAGQGGWQPGPGPMWFVEVLLLFTIVYVAMRRVFPAPEPPRVDVVSTTLLALGMGVGSFLVRTQYPVNAWLSLPTVQPAHATQYVCLFAVGIWASGSDLGARLSPKLTRYWRRFMLLATAGAIAAFFSVDVPGDGNTNLDALIGGWTWQSLAVSLWEQIFAVGMIVSLLRAFRTRWNEAGPVLSSAAASTYAVYVFHPIVVVAMAVALGSVALPSAAKFFVTVPIAVVVLFAVAPWVRRAPFLRAVL